MNAGIGHVLMIWLEQHPLTIVAADGIDIKPVQVRNLKNCLYCWRQLYSRRDTFFWKLRSCLAQTTRICLCLNAQNLHRNFTFICALQHCQLWAVWVKQQLRAYCNCSQLRYAGTDPNSNMDDSSFLNLCVIQANKSSYYCSDVPRQFSKPLKPRKLCLGRFLSHLPRRTLWHPH